MVANIFLSICLIGIAGAIVDILVEAYRTGEDLRRDRDKRKL